jgi:hypothetical protein
MNANANGLTKTISEDEREAFRKALELHYGQGMRMNDAFGQVEAGLIDRYYRRRKKYPEEVEAVNREARAAAMRKLSGDQMAFEARQIRESWRIQRAAIEMMDQALRALERIVRGEPWVVEGKTIIPYPRDRIAAANRTPGPTPTRPGSPPRCQSRPSAVPMTSVQARGSQRPSHCQGWKSTSPSS